MKHSCFHNIMNAVRRAKWPMHRAILAIFPLCLMSAPSVSSADMHAQYFDCLDQASLAMDDYFACADKFHSYCFERGEDILDAPPQTACFNKFLVERKARAAGESGLK